MKKGDKPDQDVGYDDYHSSSVLVLPPTGARSAGPDMVATLKPVRIS
jgi:hypothetical protein